MNLKQNYFRPEVTEMAGYVPGEQPKIPNILKLNTNENPYSPSPLVAAMLRNYDIDLLRRYPDPRADELCAAAARLHGFTREEVIAGNGSDDILTMIFRCFTDKERGMSYLYPSYSLYPSLADIQGCPVTRIPLNTETFELPDNLLEQARGSNLLIITRPNAPTGKSYPHEVMNEICARFDGIVVFDEAYVDFSMDSCLDLAKEFDNVLVTRTLSKSYSLAGLRLGFAYGSRKLIGGMYKVKDSYNVDRLAQLIGATAIADQAWMRNNVKMIRATRTRMIEELRQMDFKVVDSETNFVLASPPDGDAKKFFDALRGEAIIVRYFPEPPTTQYIRITVGTDEEIDRLLDFTANYLGVKRKQ